MTHRNRGKSSLLQNTGSRSTKRDDPAQSHRVEFKEKVEEIEAPAQENDANSEVVTSSRRLNRQLTSDTDRSDSAPAGNGALYIDTSRSVRPTVERVESAEGRKRNLVNVPPFVQLESLHAGRVFVSGCFADDLDFQFRVKFLQY